jgi:hypothetical protein
MQQHGAMHATASEIEFCAVAERLWPAAQAGLPSILNGSNG